MSTRFLVSLISLSFSLLALVLFYFYDKNRTLLLEKINTNQMVTLVSISNSIELDMHQLQDELKFLSELDSFNDIIINDIDKRILKIIQNKKLSQKFLIELKVLNNEYTVIAQTTKKSLNNALIFHHDIISNLSEQHKKIGTISIYIPYNSLKLYFPNNHYNFTLQVNQTTLQINSEKNYTLKEYRGHDTVHHRFYKSKTLPITITSSLTKQDVNTLLFSLWSSIAIGTIVLVTLLLLFATYYSVKLFRQRKLLQETQLKLIEEANHAAQVKSQFISQMSHEFRTPLNSIIGFSQFLDQENLVPKEYKTLPSNIEKSGKHLLRLVENILSLSTKEYHDNKNFTFQPFNINELTQEVVQLMQVQSNKKNVTLSLIENIKNIIIMIDKHTYQQVLFNLIENAIKYTKNGTIDVTINQEDSFIFIMIKDSGIGMNDISTIFTPFTRLKNTKNIKGTGLGLALVKAYVTKLKGSIEALSDGENCGSTFILKFKIHKEIQ
jgi:signal transduction histidine kinase